MPENGVWERLKLLRTDFDEYGKAQGVEIRWTKTDRGVLTFSYGFGIVIESESQDELDIFKPFKYIPDKFAYEYRELLREATMLVRKAMRDGERNDKGQLTTQALETAVNSNIRRRRTKPVTVNGR